MEFLHRWENLVGGLARAGFCLEDLREPCRAKENARPGEIGHRGTYTAPYVRMKARRLPRQPLTASRVWTPE